MLALVLHPLRHVVAVLLANDSPKQIAAGVALGMMVGLLPKGSLIAATLAVLLCAVRVNKTAGLLAAAAFTPLGPVLDPLSHRVGARLLAFEPLQGFYAWLYDQPLGPWTGVHNTVTLGALVLGLYLAYPCHVACAALLEKLRPLLAAWLKRRRVARWLLGVDLTSRVGVNPTLGSGS